MPGIRTAPDVGVAAASYKIATLSFIDADTDLVSNSLIVPEATLGTVLETYAAETQERSNASLYSVQVTSVWAGARNSSNALAAVYNNVQDNVRYSVKASPTDRQQAYIPAVLDSQLIAGTETPDSTALADWYAAVLAAVGASYSGLNVAFVEHKDRNQSIKF